MSASFSASESIAFDAKAIVVDGDGLDTIRNSFVSLDVLTKPWHRDAHPVRMFSFNLDRGTAEQLMRTRTECRVCPRPHVSMHRRQCRFRLRLHYDASESSEKTKPKRIEAAK